jgi:hypothetical protein
MGVSRWSGPSPPPGRDERVGDARRATSTPDGTVIRLTSRQRIRFIRRGRRGVPKQYLHVVRACDMLMRGFARVGIIALVDEATGYREVRDRAALQAILDQFLAKELAAWAKRFPDEFYREIFRLRNWPWKGMSVNRPSAVAQYTKDLVYERLMPNILRELERKNPKDEKGRRRARHQWLTEDVGHPALAQHLHAVIGLMRASDDWQGFQRNLQRAFPKRGMTLALPEM